MSLSSTASTLSSGVQTPVPECSTTSQAFTIVGTGLTSYEQPVQLDDSRALIKYCPSPFTNIFSLIDQPASGPAETTTGGTLIGFNSQDFRAALDRAFPNPFLRVLVAHAFKDSILMKPLEDDQMMFVTDQSGGNAGIYFKPEVASQILADYRCLATMVVMAANGLQHPENPLLPVYPRDVVNLEWSYSALPNPFPHLSLIFSSDNFVATTRAHSRQELREMYEILRFVARQYALWICDQVTRSVHKGYLSECSWGAFFGITQDDLLTMLTRKSAQRLAAEKELIRRRKERFEAGQADKRVIMGISEEASRNGAVIIHPTESKMAKTGFLTPYSPMEPGWMGDGYYPSPEVTAGEEDWEEVMKMVLETRKLE